jgi:hypothetical protein
MRDLEAALIIESVERVMDIIWPLDTTQEAQFLRVAEYERWTNIGAVSLEIVRYARELGTK